MQLNPFNTCNGSGFLRRRNSERKLLGNVGVIILCGGEGKRLSPLTRSRCKPTVSFGGRYKLIDVPISHAITSGLSNIFVVGQYLTFTLQQHIFKTYMYHGVVQDQIQLIVPEERTGSRAWYSGTADAIRQNLMYFEHQGFDYILILSGDQLYNINFQEIVNFAKKTDAGMVIAAQPIAEQSASRMGVLKIDVDDNNKLLDFYEKPHDKTILDSFYIDPEVLKANGCSDCDDKPYLCSMGIYLFKSDVLFSLLREDTRDDFGKHLICSQLKKDNVHAFIYDGYWTDIGTIASYYEANLRLTKKPSSDIKGLTCYDEHGMIYSKHHNLPGAVISDCKVTNSILCEGSILDEAEISNSIIGVRSVIGHGSLISNSIIQGYDRYHMLNNSRGIEFGIGENCIIQNTIIDENAYIGSGARLINQKGFKEYDAPCGNLVVRDGITIIPGGAVIPDGFVF